MKQLWLEENVCSLIAVCMREFVPVLMEFNPRRNQSLTCLQSVHKYLSIYRKVGFWLLEGILNESSHLKMNLFSFFLGFIKKCLKTINCFLAFDLELFFCTCFPSSTGCHSRSQIGLYSTVNFKMSLSYCIYFGSMIKVFCCNFIVIFWDSYKLKWSNGFFVSS